MASSHRIQLAAVHGLIPLHHSRSAEVAAHSVTTTPWLEVCSFFDRSRKLRRRIAYDPRLTVRHKLGERSSTQADDWRPARHRLDDGEAEGFVPEHRAQEARGAGQESLLLVGSHLAKPLHPRAQSGSHLAI